jgi:glycosyltransferase involved in cell wall biosynthesis
MYLGRRGGGSNLLLETSLGLQNRGFPHQIIISTRLENDLMKKISFQKNEFLVPHNLFELIPLTVLLVPKVLLLALQFRKARKALHVVVVMPQFVDVFFLKILKRLIEIKITYIIHEVHGRGRLPWPTEKAIKRRLKISNFVITFNSTIDKFIATVSSVEHIIIPLESRNFFGKQKKSKIKEPYFLWVGRNDSYKGLNNLYEAWEQFGVKSSYKLIVAGSGVEPLKKLKNIEFISRWLSDAEIWQLVRDARYLILPYLNSTQSGILAMANAEATPAIITPVPELIEQSNARDIVLPDFSVKSIVNQLKLLESYEVPREQLFNQGPTELVKFIMRK